MKSRNLLFILFNIFAFIAFFLPIKELIKLSFHSELYSHIMLIPVVSGYIIFSQRKEIFSSVEYSATAGIVPIIGGSVLYLIGIWQGTILSQNDYLSLMTFSAVIIWVGGFILFYGTQTFRNASFPLLFLIFMIPIPGMLVEQIIFLLQSASADISHGFFNLTGEPVYRDGFIFQLTGITIEVAKECSGIRSSIALFITSVLLGHFFLQTKWKKIALCLSVIPLAIVKNGLRIVTISLLSVHIDKSFLTSSLLHSQGGILFYIIALLLLCSVLWVLRKLGKRENHDKLTMTYGARESVGGQ